MRQFLKFNVFLNIGKILYKIKEYKQAWICFKKAVELEPENDHYLLKKGNCLKSLKKYDEAINCFNKLIQMNPTGNSNAYYLKGACLIETKNYREALKLFEKALEIEPNNQTFLKKKNLTQQILNS